jgi:hypothetical protein
MNVLTLKTSKITVTGTHPDPDSFNGIESGTLVTLDAGTYKVSEDEHKDFKTEFSGDCNANGSGTIKANEHQRCTITNVEQDKEMKNY